MAKHSRAITLLELLIASTLLGFVAIAINSLSSFASFQLLTSDRRSQLQNEASFCMEQMFKDVSRGIGWVGNPGVYCLNDDLQIRIDSNKNGRIDPVIGVDNDTLVRYFKNGINLEYYADFGRDSGPGGMEVLTNKLANTSAMITYSDGIVQIDMILRHIPSQAASSVNPQLRMLSCAYMRSESVK